MAAARTFGPTSEDRVLAVDSTRLRRSGRRTVRRTGWARRTGWPRSCTHRRPTRSRWPTVRSLWTRRTGGPRRRIFPSGCGSTSPTRCGETGGVEVGPLTPDRRSYEAQRRGCRAGCRLVSLEIVAPAPDQPGRGGHSRAVRARPGDGPSRDPAAGARRRDPLAPAGRRRRHRHRSLRASDGRARLISLYDGAVPAETSAMDPRVFVVDAPTPLPVVLAGERPPPRRTGDERITVLGTERVPFEVVGTAGRAAPARRRRRAGRPRVRPAAASAGPARPPPWRCGSPRTRRRGIVAGLEAQGVQLMREETADRRRTTGSPGRARGWPCGSSSSPRRSSCCSPPARSP